MMLVTKYVIDHSTIIIFLDKSRHECCLQSHFGFATGQSLATGLGMTTNNVRE